MSDIAIEDSGRVRSLAELSVYGQRYGARGAGGEYSTTRRIPRPYPSSKFTWDPKRDIARIPSVKIIGSHPTPAERQLSPQISINTDSQNRSNEEWKAPKEHLIAPSPKARRDALRLTPYMQQKVQPFRIIGEMQNRVVRFMRGR